MPYQRPTLSQLRADAASDVTANITGADGLLRFGNLPVLADILAGMANLHYGYLDWIAQQDVPITATDERLEGWAAFKDIIRESAAAATGTVTFNGTNGADLPNGTAIARSDGRSYITTADGTVASGTVTVPVVDETPGAAGNTPSGTAFTLGIGISGIQSNGTAATAFTGGADVETNDSLRARMLAAFQAPPQGGDANDYEEWASQVAGVTRVWVLRNGMGAGTVVVYFMMDEAESIHNGFPQGSNGVAALETRASVATGDQLAVANYIFPLQPVTALVYAVAPTASPQNFTIAGLSPNTTAMKTAVGNAISDVFFREGATNTASGTGGTINFSDIQASIEAVPGIVDFIITSPTVDITTSVGYLPTLGTITWT